MVKVFTPNANGKIEFTKEELEALLNEVWNDGYSQNRQYWWTSPTWTASNVTTQVKNQEILRDSITCKNLPYTATYSTTTASGGADDERET